LNHFKYLGKKKVEEVNELLESAHLFVNTSQRGGEGFPNTFIQAWLRCVPVVSLEVNPDQLLDGQNTGICSGHFDQLVEDVKTLLSDVGRLAQMGKTARKIAIAHYSTQNCQQILDLMEQ
jgi:glycosyltransferase involved in cell wall biosynthesis